MEEGDPLNHITLVAGSLWLTTLVLFVIIALRYLAFAGFAYFVCWKWKRSLWAHKRINPVYPPAAIMRAEIKWSLLTSIIFAVTGTFMVYAWQEGIAPVYYRIGDYGYAYFVFSIFLLMFLQDTYFYFMHRWVHWPYFFQKIHQVHHDSRNPTPWAAFSFHPLESLLEALIIPVLVLLVPAHPVAFLIFLMIMTASSVLNHVGYELFPAGFYKNRVLKWLIGATHHQMHHQKYNCNFGLYFTFWDWLLKTNDRDHPKFFNEIKQRF